MRLLQFHTGVAGTMKKMHTSPISDVKRDNHKMNSNGTATIERQCAQRLIHDPYAPIVTPKLSNTLQNEQESKNGQLLQALRRNNGDLEDGTSQ